MEQPRKKILLKLLIPWLLFFAACAVAVHFYQEVSILRMEIPKSPDEQIADIVSAVGKLIILPTGEMPTVATVTDVAAAQSQWPELFANAKAGDKVLMYAKAQKGILYDPNANIIVATAPFNIVSPNTATTTATSSVATSSAHTKTKSATH